MSRNDERSPRNIIMYRQIPLIHRRYFRLAPLHHILRRRRLLVSFFFLIITFVVAVVCRCRRLHLHNHFLRRRLCFFRIIFTISLAFSSSSTSSWSSSSLSPSFIVVVYFFITSPIFPIIIFSAIFELIVIYFSDLISKLIPKYIVSLIQHIDHIYEEAH